MLLETNVCCIKYVISIHGNARSKPEKLMKLLPRRGQRQRTRCAQASPPSRPCTPMPPGCQTRSACRR